MGDYKAGAADTGCLNAGGDDNNWDWTPDTSLGGSFVTKENKRDRFNRAQKELRKDLLMMKSKSKSNKPPAQPSPGELADVNLTGLWSNADLNRNNNEWLMEHANMRDNECGLDFNLVGKSNANLLYAVKFNMLRETLRDLRGTTLDFSLSPHARKPRLEVLKIATQPYANLRSFANELEALSDKLTTDHFLPWQRTGLPPAAMSSFTDHGAVPAAKNKRVIL